VQGGRQRKIHEEGPVPANSPVTAHARTIGNGEWPRIDPVPIKSDDKRARAVVSLTISWKLP